MLQEVISAILQVLAFALIPFIVHLVRKKRIGGFGRYIGMKAPTAKAIWLSFASVAVFAAPVLLFAFLDPGFMDIMTDPKSVTGKIRAMGFSGEAVGILVVTAVFKTALAEEIFFRGWVAKVLICKINYPIGNLIHAVLFGGLHLALFAAISQNPLYLGIIFIFPTLGAYLMVHINEKHAHGSIVPSWITHALANLISYTSIGFFAA